MSTAASTPPPPASTDDDDDDIGMVRELTASSLIADAAVRGDWDAVFRDIEAHREEYPMFVDHIVEIVDPVGGLKKAPASPSAPQKGAQLDGSVASCEPLQLSLLSYACATKHLQAVLRLLALGADPRLPASDGQVPLDTLRRCHPVPDEDVDQIAMAIQRATGTPPPNPQSPSTSPATDNLLASPLYEDGDPRNTEIVWFAMGDWGGSVLSLKVLAKTMAKKAEKYKPRFIMCLGDNFYPAGVVSCTDMRFRTQWQEVFLVYESLRVPYKVVLGNHDIKLSDGTPQVDFTNHLKNPDGLWQMRGNDPKEAPSRTYSFTEVAPTTGLRATFYAMNTNSASKPVRAGMKEQLAKRRSRWNKECKTWLEDALQKNLATNAGMPTSLCWNIGFGHHPMYCQGKGHFQEAIFLREDEGLGLRKTFTEGKVDVYVSGHDHVLAYHHEKDLKHHNGGIHHVVSGAATESHAIGGKSDTAQIGWFGSHVQGFNIFRLKAIPSPDGGKTPGGTTLTIEYIDAKTQAAVHKVEITK